MAAINTRLMQVITKILSPSFRRTDWQYNAAHSSEDVLLRKLNSAARLTNKSAKQVNRFSGSMDNSLSPALQALTTAALMLPGIMIAQAADDEVTIQYGHYEEAKRDIFGVVNISDSNMEKQKLPNNFAPITVDSIHAQAKTTLKDRWKFTANYSEDTWSGATPMTTAPVAFNGNRAFFLNNATGKHDSLTASNNFSVTGASPILVNDIKFDKEFNPVLFKGSDLGGDDILEIDRQLTHTMTMASPETRKQGDFKLGYEWDEAAVDVGGGLSVESDYESRFVNWGGRLDFNNKLTTLNFSQSYTNSTISALLDHDALQYVSTVGYALNGRGDSGYVKDVGGPVVDAPGVNKMLKGLREDIATNFSLTQVLNKSALIEAGAGYTHSSGFMENPYKATFAFFVDPTGFGSADFVSPVATAYSEERPNSRNQVNLNLRYVQHIEPLDAAMNLKYNYFLDDWGINAHTFEGKWVQPLPWGLTVTPTIRYYSQSAADFYHPFLVVKEAALNSTIAPGVGPGPEERNNYRILKQHYAHFSSDHRLSAYGALSGGVVVNKQFARGLSLEMGFEYYTHQGSLKLGGGGEDSFADFSGYSANAALKVDLGTVGRGLADGGDHAHHPHHDHGPQNPAGLMFDHMLTQTDSWMIGYQYMHSRQAGQLLQGTQAIADSAVTLGNLANNPNCAGEKCFVAPLDMTMQMHMFMVMYAPTDWLNLMLMPSFMDMSMNMRSLQGADPCPAGASGIVGAACQHTNHEHQTGGIGDTNISTLFKLYDDKTNHLHLTLGVSAPTGDVGIKLRPNHQTDLGFIHYGMQLGSGTWDFTPSLTYTGHLADWGWGAQVQGIKRLESRNESGFALGDMLQGTAWGSYQLLDWLGGTVRGIYTTQGALRGEFNGLHVPVGTMDTPANHGGRYWDIGVGMTATIPSGSLAGNALSVEWLQPLEDDVNGIQLERDGALSAKWSYMF